MLMDNINTLVKQMKQLDLKESAALDAERKNKNDNDYAELVDAYSKTVKTISRSNQHLGFKPSQSVIDELENAATSLEGVVEIGFVDETECKNTKNKIVKSITPELSKEWTVFYKQKTQGVNSKLSTVSNLVNDDNKIQTIRSGIDSCCKWDDLVGQTDQGENMVIGFSKALSELEQIENSLSLTDGIKEFISKAQYGNARISDLSDEVLAWIKKENLDDMFVVVFDD